MTPEEIQDLTYLAKNEKKLNEAGLARLTELRAKIPGQPGFLNRQAIFAGRGALDTYQGAKQKALQGIDSQAAEDYTARVNRELADFEPLRAGYPTEAAVSRFIGNAASLPIGGPAGSLGTRMLAAGGLGGGMGAVQYDPENDPANTLRNAGLGVAGAVGLEGAVSGAKGLLGVGRQSSRAMPAPVPPSAAAAASHRAAGRTPRGYEYYDPEFSIPYSEGQETGNLTRQQLEQRMSRDAFGQRPGEEIRELWDYQQRRGTDAMMEAGTDLVQGDRAQQLVPEGSRGGREYQTAQGAGDTLKQKLSERANALWDDVGNAFDRAKGSGAAVEAAEASRVVDRVMSSIDEYDMKAMMADPKQYPELDGVSARLKSFIPEQVAGKPPQAMDVEGLHAMRRILSEARADKSVKNKEKRILGNMVEAMDQEMMRLIDQGLVRGSDDALSALQQGIKLRADYGRLYGPRGKRTRSGRNIGDKPGEAIEQIIETDLSGEDVANLIFGKGQIGNNANTVGILKRVKRAAGKESDEYQALRNMALERLRLDVTQAGTDVVSAQKLTTHWKRLRSKRADLLGELYTNDEIAKIDRLVKAMDKTRYKEEAMNRSGTAHMIEAMFNTLPPAIGASIGGAVGGPVGAAGGAATAWVAAKVGQDAKNLLGKVFATRVYERLPRGIPPSIGAAAALRNEEFIGGNPRRTNVNRIGGMR